MTTQGGRADLALARCGGSPPALIYGGGRMQKLIVIAIMLMMATQGHAETKNDKIAKLMAAQGAIEMWQQQLDRGQVETEKYAKRMFEQAMSQLQPNEVIKEQMNTAYNKFVNKIKNPWTAKEIVDVWAKYYGSYFTEKELDQLIIFYTSDIGQKDVVASRKALVDFTSYIQQARQPVVEKAMREYVEDMKKIVSDSPGKIRID